LAEALAGSRYAYTQTEPLPMDHVAAALACEAAAESYTLESVEEAYRLIVAARHTGLACIEAPGMLLTLYTLDGVALGAHLEAGYEEYSGEEALDRAEEAAVGPVRLQLAPLQPWEAPGAEEAEQGAAANA